MRSFPRTRLVCLLLLVLAGAARALEAAPPNIVLILSDDQAYTDYGFMGHPVIQTPHLDRLARESAVFGGAMSRPPSAARPSFRS